MKHRSRAVLVFSLIVCASKSQAQSNLSILDEIRDYADNSSCLKKSHKNRGTAPKGFLRGLALTFARSYCRMRLNNPPSPKEPGAFISAKASGSSSKDVLDYYKSTFSSVGLDVNDSGWHPLLAEYTLAVGFGMQESSGKYCEGYDKAAGKNRSSSEAEAGLYQTSYNSIAASKALQRLYDEYKNDSSSRCFLKDYSTGVTCKHTASLGSGTSGLNFQKFTKQCPAFATEYALMLIRVLRKHYGPLNTKSAQVFGECKDFFRTVGAKVARDLTNYCAQID